MRPYRKDRVASVIQEVVGAAVCRHLNDPRVDPLTTITRVEVSGDLLIAKVFVSVPGGSAVENRTIAALKHATGFVQRLVAKELQLRQCPELRFSVDERVKGVRRTMDLLDENRRAHPEWDAQKEEVDSTAVEERDVGPADRSDAGMNPGSTGEEA